MPKRLLVPHRQSFPTSTHDAPAPLRLLSYLAEYEKVNLRIWRLERRYERASPVCCGILDPTHDPWTAPRGHIPFESSFPPPVAQSLGPWISCGVVEQIGREGPAVGEARGRRHDPEH